MRRYSVYIEDMHSGGEWFVCRRFTRKGMVRRVRRGNATLRPLGVRFYGQEDR